MITDSIGSFARFATKMARNYLFTSTLVHWRSIDAKKYLRLSEIAMFPQDRFRSVILSVNTVEQKTEKMTIWNRD